MSLKPIFAVLTSTEFGFGFGQVLGENKTEVVALNSWFSGYVCFYTHAYTYICTYFGVTEGCLHYLAQKRSITGMTAHGLVAEGRAWDKPGERTR